MSVPVVQRLFFFTAPPLPMGALSGGAWQPHGKRDEKRAAMNLPARSIRFTDFVAPVFPRRYPRLPGVTLCGPKG